MKKGKLLTLALVGSLASSALIAPISSYASTNIIESSTSSEGGKVLEKDTKKLGNYVYSYEVIQKGDIIEYNLDTNGKKDILTYNTTTNKLTLNGNPTTINNLLGSTNNVNSILSIPQDV